MRFGRAIKLAFFAALVVGPALGLLGACLTILISAVAFGGSWSGGGVMIIAAFFGMVLGLIIASPVTLIFGACLVLLGSRNRRWLHPLPVAAVGIIPGVGAGLAVGANDGAGTMAVLGTAGAVLGIVGALMFRALVKDRIHYRIEAVDPAIFA
jgi:hypothetical protein